MPSSIPAKRKAARQELSRIGHRKAHPFSLRPQDSFIFPDWRLYAIERRKSLSSSTLRLDLALVRPLFTVASQDWAMELGPQFTARTLPKVRNSRNLRFSPEEAEAIVRSTGSPVLDKLLRVALETAMRRNEITKMRGG